MPLTASPALGGCRMAVDVTTREVCRLARAMTLKNALSNLPHGGAKSAILANPRTWNKEILIHCSIGMAAVAANAVPLSHGAEDKRAAKGNLT